VQCSLSSCFRENPLYIDAELSLYIPVKQRNVQLGRERGNWHLNVKPYRRIRCIFRKRRMFLREHYVKLGRQLKLILRIVTDTTVKVALTA